MRIVMVLVLAALVASPAGAQSTMQYRGVIVGISAYMATESKPAMWKEGAAYSAGIFKDILISTDSGPGWPLGNIVFKQNSQATKTLIRTSVQNLPDGAGCLNLYYHAGHGEANGVETHDRERYSPSELQTDIGTNFERFIAIIDACGSGGFPASMNKGVVMSACRSDESEYTMRTLQSGADSVSIFTYYLKQGFTANPGARSEHNAVSGRSLHNYAAPLATAFAYYYQVSVHPQLANNYLVDLFFTTVQHQIDFVNDLPEYGQGGPIKVYESQVTSPTYGVVAEANTITAEAVTQSHNYLDFSFKCWTNNLNGDTLWNQYITLMPDTPATYTAHYSMKPQAPTYLTIVGEPGDQVQLTWTDNPNQYVTRYLIYRSPDKHEDYVLVDSVNSGVQTWTDPYYQITAGYTHLLLGYAVVAKYIHGSVIGCSDYAWASTYGKLGAEPRIETSGGMTAVLTPTEYAVGNYPNPFNPWTIIRYELVEPGDVLLEIYDVMGRRVAVLVDATRSAGSHSIAWHATDDAGGKVASGMYLYRFTARPLSGGKPFAKSGKLLYTK